MSPMIATEWSSLAGLLNIPYYKQEDIRLNHTKYPSLTSKAKKIFKLFNASKVCSRAALKKHFKELGRDDVGCEMLRFENEVCCNLNFFYPPISLYPHIIICYFLFNSYRKAIPF